MAVVVLNEECVFLLSFVPIQYLRPGHMILFKNWKSEQVRQVKLDDIGTYTVIVMTSMLNKKLSSPSNSNYTVDMRYYANDVIPCLLTPFERAELESKCRR